MEVFTLTVELFTLLTWFLSIKKNPSYSYDKQGHKIDLSR